jgi:glutamate synthase (ferredoxin)
LCRSCGVPHPALISGAQLEFLDGAFGSRPVTEPFGYLPVWGFPSPEDQAAIRRIMAAPPEQRALADAAD